MHQGELTATGISALLVFIIDLHLAAGDHKAFSLQLRDHRGCVVTAYSGGTARATSGAADVAKEHSGPGRALEVLAVDEEPSRPAAVELSTYQ